jgi:LPS-assembly lipoprotein
MRMSSAQPPLATAFLLLAVAALSLAGCGFQPRGHTSATAGIPSPITIRGIAEFSDLYRELARQLKIAGVEPAPPGTRDVPALYISDTKADRRLLSVNSRNKAVEFELIENATFAMRSADGRQLVPPQELRVIRIQYRPEIAVLGSNREAELLRMDMREELAGRIIQSLAAQYAAAE